MKHFILLALCACLTVAFDDFYDNLSYAIQNGQEEVVKTLISNDSEIEKVRFGDFIHLAAKNDKLSMLKILLDKKPELNNVKNSEGETPLLSAALQSGDVIKYLISKGADVNARENSYQRTALHICAVYGKEQCAKLLIVAKADLNAKFNGGWAPLHETANAQSSWHDLQGAVKVTKLLIENGADVNAKSDDGRTPLFVSTFRGNKDISKTLIDNCAVVTAKDVKLETPLHKAKDQESMNLLLEYKADVNARFNNKGTPCESLDEKVAFAPFGNNPSPFDVPLLRAIFNDQEEIVKAMVHNNSEILNEKIKGHLPIHFAAAYNKENMVKILIENNPEMVTVANDYGKTPLSLALEGNEGAENLMDYLISKGADINPNGTTPLHFAAKYGLENVAKLLIENKADVNAKDTNGNTPLYYAVEKGHEIVAKLLIDNKADVNVQDNEGWTPLLQSADHGYENIAKLLIDAKADVNTSQNSGYTALHSATHQGHINIVKLLVENNANVNAKENNGHSILHFASMQGNKDAVAVLMENNADPKALNSYSDTPCDIIYYNGGRKQETYDDIFALMKCTLPVFCSICSSDRGW